ncbi:anterior gradient 1 [Notolabrus celidotus]|uniref:anterior gradient 1 n=1 Tax=Notolabrus celidotus TaxID=1203425 RepID=UPI00148F8AF4|nr:anterior gradient 1 [Notolabrus celidotus]XP_034550207.1 anterior gradient 1 [Notolabrus celidotus]
MLRWVLFVLFFGICAAAVKQKAKVTKPPNLSRGWGDGITWVKNYEEGLSKMVKSKKPLMVIHHREDCPHSKELKKAFLAKRSVLKMAKEDFIMLNVVEEIPDVNMAPDGYYVPRILFVDPTKVVRNDIMGKYSDYRFNYRADDMELLKLNMMKAKLPLDLRTEL